MSGGSSETRTRRGRAPKYPQLVDHDWLLAHLHLRTADIARKVGCGPSLIAIAYRRAGINRPGRRSSDNPWYPQLRDPANLHGRTTRELIDETGATPSTVARAFKHAGITPARPKILRPTQFPQLEDPTWLHQHRKWALSLIADELGCSPTRVADAYRTARIKR